MNKMEKRNRFRDLLIRQGRMASKIELEAFIAMCLKKEGIKMDIQFKEISIPDLFKLVKAVYNLGYNDGKEQRSTLKRDSRMVEVLGDAMTRHTRFGREFRDSNQINKLK